ncbi:MAG: hypothetical protein IKS21_07555 [Oscillospiraceae bacterium]|nr:hypothetical protein [Oscillospiraceae bacterium]
MRIETFKKFWEPTFNSWLGSLITNNEGQPCRISALCRLKEDPDGSATIEKIHTTYETIKENAKIFYFKNSAQTGEAEGANHRLSRYKRAAVLTYAILVADPLCKLDGSSLDLDPLFLKQRLAFYLALSSIIQDFDEGRIKEILMNEKRPVFQLAGLGESDREKELDDDFCMSLYKDLFFSEYYGNYNILTMANVYGLLTERCSCLLECRTEKNKK